MKKPLLDHLHHYFFPHKKNGYKPHIFRTASVGFIILGVLVLEGTYLTQIKFVFPHTNFLGAVLPGALIALTNNDRIANNLSVVNEDAQLVQAAQEAASDMATNGYFAHVSPDGKDPWYWLNLVGYKYQYAGQNLAVNFTDSSAVESAWMASPEHHANIVKREYTQIGIGTANGLYEGKEATFVVQFFASSAIVSPQQQKGVAVASTPEAAVAAPVAPVLAQKGSLALVASTLEEVGAPTESVGAEVLGTQAQVATVSANPSPIAGFFYMIATSPTLTMTYTLSALAIIILLLLIVAIVMRARAVYIETIAGALILLIVLLGVLFFNVKSAAKVQVSANVQNTTITY